MRNSINGLFLKSHRVFMKIFWIDLKVENLSGEFDKMILVLNCRKKFKLPLVIWHFFFWQQTVWSRKLKQQCKDTAHEYKRIYKKFQPISYNCPSAPSYNNSIFLIFYTFHLEVLKFGWTKSNEFFLPFGYMNASLAK